jgi:hypothetical protein
MAKKKNDLMKYVLAPDILQYKDLQVFDFHGKDARGFDFGVRLSSAEALPLMDEMPAAVDADRVNMYAGSDPKDILKIDTEIEVTMGKEKEVHKITAATMTYVPKGVPYRHRALKKSDKTTWVLTLTLPPKYIPPEKPGK